MIDHPEGAHVLDLAAIDDGSKIVYEDVYERLKKAANLNQRENLRRLAGFVTNLMLQIPVFFVAKSKMQLLT